METKQESSVSLTNPEDVLTDTERVALIAYRKEGVQLRLSGDTQMKLFSLFLNGHPCSELQALNRQFSLGQILTARLEGNWDKRRQEHVEGLYANVLSRIQQSSVEAVGFVADQLAAVHKMYGEKARRYLQSGDPKDFDSFGADDIKNYKVLVETLQKLTGQEKASTEVNISGSVPKPERDITPERRPLTSTRAAEIVRLANLKKKG